MSKYTPQNDLFGSALLSSPKEMKFTAQEFLIDTSVFNIKYDHLELQNNNFF